MKLSDIQHLLPFPFFSSLCSLSSHRTDVVAADMQDLMEKKHERRHKASLKVLIF